MNGRHQRGVAGFVLSVLPRAGVGRCAGRYWLIHFIEQFFEFAEVADLGKGQCIENGFSGSNDFFHDFARSIVCFNTIE